MDAAELILEIGTEEIPSGYLSKGMEEFKRLAGEALEENRIPIADDLHTYGTPRRLVLIGEEISKRQEDLVQEITGPPEQVAYDEEGNPTKAAVGFAQKQGVSVGDLQTIETPKGSYVHLQRRVPGQKTEAILREVLPGLISKIPWPKSMRWGSIGFPFVRPIHWILCLFDGEVVPFEIAGLKSGPWTRGHRFLAPAAFEVKNIAEYREQMRKGRVVIDPEERRAEVNRLTKQAAETVGGIPMNDPELQLTVTHLVEHPFAVCGGFDKGFLSLPEDVLITAMKAHQKYFAVYDKSGKLMPHFVAINNTEVKDASVVQRGHERVLRARLSDAAFFYEEDRKKKLLDRLEDLKGVIYQAELGTSYDKVMRFTRLAETLAAKLLPDSVEEVKQIAQLSKCDLVTLMVNEFPSLQGIMGRAYAKAEGYPLDIASGIYEHYLPLRAGGRLPASEAAAIVGVADRMDTIAGCFAVGLEPTGSADPFALRRHALAIIRIIEQMGWSLSLQAMIHEALTLLAEGVPIDDEDIHARILSFLRERYKNMMRQSGYSSDLIEAVIATGFDDIRPLRAKIDHLKQFSEVSDQFNGLALTFKRVSNILKNQHIPFDVDPSAFEESSESALWETYETLGKDIRRAIEEEDFEETLALMVRFKGPVDEFFDRVEVLTQESERLMQNRVGMLQHITELMGLMADFSKFSI